MSFRFVPRLGLPMLMLLIFGHVTLKVIQLITRIDLFTDTSLDVHRALHYGPDYVLLLSL